jgi:hypothetical protein
MSHSLATPNYSATFGQKETVDLSIPKRVPTDSGTSNNRPETSLTGFTKLRRQMDRKAQIYCPHCKFRPRAEDRWFCVPSCGTVWNTFWTRGVCPGCSVRWPQTQCLQCDIYSPHEEWYHYPEPDKVCEDSEALQEAGR